jgi:hypothetical protein
VNAVGRLDALLPPAPDPEDFKVTASQALTWTKLLTARFGELDGTVGALYDGFSCAVKYGVVQAAAYALPNLQQAGVIFIVSGPELANPSPQVLACLAKKALNGGPGSAAQFDPCYANFAITADVGNVTGSYYIFVAGTDQSWCEDMENDFRQYQERGL